MATNFYFNNFGSSQEQLLIESLIVESIKIYGMDVYYLPRRLLNLDEIYGESQASRFDKTYPIEMYIRNIDSFEGDGTFLSKFNLEIRDQVTFTVARKAFFDETLTEQRERPFEGDLIFFPLNNKLFEIKYVQQQAIFYQLGALQTWDLRCEVFEYNNEIFETGIAAIDNIQKNNSLALTDYGLRTEDTIQTFLVDEYGYTLVNEDYDIDTNAGDAFAENDEIQMEADAFLDFTERDPFSEGGTY